MAAGLIPQAAYGTDDTGPDTKLWMLHPHERVLSAQENREYSRGGGGTTVNINLGGVSVKDGKDVVKEVLRALETNEGKIKDKVRSIVSPIKNQNLKSR